MSSDSLYFVLSHPPATVDDADFNAWYTRHIGEILTVEGFEAGRLYALRTRADAGAFPYRYLALYRIAGDPDEALERLYAASETDQVFLPAWFEEVPFVAWTSSPEQPGAADPFAAGELRVHLSSEKPNGPRGEHYELTEGDVDERLPRYRWAEVAIGPDQAADAPTASGTDPIRLECSPRTG